MLTGLLALAGLLAGLAGAWSPCGLSMVDTLAQARRRTTAGGCAAFAAGAMAGAVAAFAGLALLGAALGTAGGAAVAVAAALLLAAAAGDAAGRRIVPQIRRQVPESWRRLMPLPLAAGLYGVLLGLGFTTFVLSLSTYALAAASLALGAPAAGLAAGLGFGAGRTIPVVVLALGAGGHVLAERPGVLRGLRGAAGAACAACALTLALGGAPARAAELFTADGADPSADGEMLVWEAGDDRGVIMREGRIDALPGADPAAGGGRVAWRLPDRIVIADAQSLEPVLEVVATGVDAVAVSADHLAWREHDPAAGRDYIRALDLAAPATTVRTLGEASALTSALGRPSLDGRRLLFHVNGVQFSRIVEVDLATGLRFTLRRARSALLLQPTALGEALLYVRSSFERQELIVGSRFAGGPAGPDRVLHTTFPTGRRDLARERGRARHGAGYPGKRPPPLPPVAPRALTATLWTTALTPTMAYVTQVRAQRGTRPAAEILRAPLAVATRRAPAR